VIGRLLPLFVFAALVGLLLFGIEWNKHHEMTEVPSPLVGKPAPEFTLPLLYDSTKTVSRKDLLGKPYLLNVFGSWCPTCQEEHPILTAKIKPLGIRIIGLDWRDPPESGKGWLKQFGNPYELVLSDEDGKAGVDFGVYGAPETFLVDANGQIVYKRTGMFTPQNIREELLPKIAQLGAAK
jgi:cytochrome c biogenesis protein CcmG, thiol:disulfide interchange protein DsbE